MDETKRTSLENAARFIERGNYHAAKQSLIPVLRDGMCNQETAKLLSTIYEQEGKFSLARHVLVDSDKAVAAAFEDRLHDNLETERSSLPGTRRLVLALFLFLAGGLLIALALPNSVPLELLEFLTELKLSLFSTYGPIILVVGALITIIGLVMIAMWPWSHLSYRRRMAKAYPPPSFMDQTKLCASCGLLTPSRRCIHCGVKYVGTAQKDEGLEVKVQEVKAPEADNLEIKGSEKQLEKELWWWIDEGGTRFGPCSTFELSEAASAGKFDSQRLVWRKGDQWRPAKEVPSLCDILKQRVPTSGESTIQTTRNNPIPILKLFVVGTVGVVVYLFFNGNLSGSGSYLGSSPPYSGLVQWAESKHKQLLDDLKKKHDFNDLEKLPVEVLLGAMRDFNQTLTEHAAKTTPPTIKVAVDSEDQIINPEISAPTGNFSFGTLTLKFPVRFTLKSEAQYVRFRAMGSNNTVLEDSIVFLPIGEISGRRVASTITLTEQVELVTHFELYIEN